MRQDTQTPSEGIGSGFAGSIPQPGGSGDARRNPPINGFTLIEMVLVLSVVGLLSAAAAVGFLPVFDSWEQGESRSEAADTLAVALSRMIEEISQMKDAQSVVIAGASDFQFTDVNSNSIRYRLSGDQLLRNSDILARGVQTLTFSYWDINNAAVTSPTLSPAATNLWRMSVTISGVKGSQTVTLESQIHPRNLKRS